MKIRPLMATVSLLSVLAAPVVGQTEGDVMISEVRSSVDGSVRIFEDAEEEFGIDLEDWVAKIGDYDDRTSYSRNVAADAFHGLAVAAYGPVTREGIDGSFFQEGGFPDENQRKLYERTMKQGN